MGRTLEQIADLGELRSVNREVGGDTANGESENESDGEKSGVHRRDNYQTLRRRGGMKPSARKHSICTEGGDGKLRAELETAHCPFLAGAVTSFLTARVTILFIRQKCSIT